MAVLNFLFVYIHALSNISPAFWSKSYQSSFTGYTSLNAESDVCKFVENDAFHLLDLEKEEYYLVAVSRNYVPIWTV